MSFSSPKGSSGTRPQLRMFSTRVCFCCRGRVTVTISLSKLFSKASMIVSMTTILYCGPRLLKSLQQCPPPGYHPTGLVKDWATTVQSSCSDQLHSTSHKSDSYPEVLSSNLRGRVCLHPPSQADETHWGELLGTHLSRQKGAREEGARVEW